MNVPEVADETARGSRAARHVATPRPRPWWRVDALVVGVLLIAWAVLTLRRLPLPYPSDQFNYLNAAMLFPHGFPHPDAGHQVMRFGLVVPVRLATYAFGYTEAGYHLVPLLATALLLVATYALGALLYARVVGVAAAVVLATAGPVVEDAGALLPDLPATALFTAAVALAVAVRTGKLPGRAWVLVAIGALLGWSYTVREFIVFGWPLVPLVLYRTVRWRGLALVAAPVAAIGALELALCRALYGSPLARVHAILTQRPNPATGYAGHPRATYLTQLPQALDQHPGGVFLTALLVLVPAGVLLARRRLAVPAIWCALIWVPLTLAGGVLHPDDPSLRLELLRYWFPILPALAIGGLATIWLAAHRLRGAGPWPPAAVAGIVAVASAAVALAGGWRDPVVSPDVNGRAQMAAFRTWMHRHDGVTAHASLWTDSRTDSLAELYRRGPFGGIRWHAMTRTYAPRGPRPNPGDLVLFFDAGTDAPPGSGTGDARACAVCRRAARELWGVPPRPDPSWRPVFATPDGVVRLYRVTGPR